MEIGMMWFDDDKKRGLVEKVQRAVDYYRQKYGELPTRCYVHPRMLAGDASITQVGTVFIETSRSIQPNHFWLGVENPVSEAAQ